MSSNRAVALAALVLAATVAAPGAWAQTAPRPSPPRGVLPPATTPASPQPQARPAAPAPVPAQPAPPVAQASEGPSEAVLGVAVYPGSTFLGSYDAGQGQRYYLFGTPAAFTHVVTFYRGVLKERGDEVFDTPPIWTFDLGRFREQTMAFPPSVTVRDHMSDGKGYLHAAGSREQRFPTVIQIVPPPPGESRR